VLVLVRYLPSLCVSPSVTSRSRTKMAKITQRRTILVAQGLWFSDAKNPREILMGSLSVGAPNMGGGWLKSVAHGLTV